MRLMDVKPHVYDVHQRVLCVFIICLVTAQRPTSYCATWIDMIRLSTATLVRQRSYRCPPLKDDFLRTRASCHASGGMLEHA